MKCLIKLHLNFDSRSKICSKCMCTYLGYTWPPVRFSNYFFFVELSDFIKDYLNFPCIFKWNFQWSFRISNDLFTWWFDFIFFLFCCFSVSITLDNFLTEYNLLNYNFLNDLFNYGFLNKYIELIRLVIIPQDNCSRLKKKSHRSSANIVLCCICWMNVMVYTPVFWCRISVERI